MWRRKRKEKKERRRSFVACISPVGRGGELVVCITPVWRRKKQKQKKKKEKKKFCCLCGGKFITPVWQQACSFVLRPCGGEKNKNKKKKKRRRSFVACVAVSLKLVVLYYACGAFVLRLWGGKPQVTQALS